MITNQGGVVRIFSYSNKFDTTSWQTAIALPPLRPDLTLRFIAAQNEQTIDSLVNAITNSQIV